MDFASNAPLAKYQIPCNVVVAEAQLPTILLPDNLAGQIHDGLTKLKTNFISRIGVEHQSRSKRRHDADIPGMQMAEQNVSGNRGTLGPDIGQIRVDRQKYSNLSNIFGLSDTDHILFCALFFQPFDIVQGIGHWIGEHPEPINVP